MMFTQSSILNRDSTDVDKNKAENSILAANIRFGGLALIYTI